MADKRRIGIGMKAVISGGGTAGHINPAIAIAERLRSDVPESDILFIGTPGGMENRLVSAAGYTMEHIRVSGLRRSLSPSNFRAAYQFFSSQIEAAKILRRFSPDIVVGTGGYVCFPVLRAAARLGIPSAVHESNAVPGLTVRMLSRNVDRILLNFPDAAGHLSHPERAVVTGNPIRDDFLRISRESARRSLHIGPNERYLLSFGGSLGSVSLNQSILSVMEVISYRFPTVRMLHATGTAHEQICRAEYNKLFPNGHPRLKILSYISDMPLHMRAADCIVSRSGAMTLSEIALVGCPSVLIPFPGAAGDHQTKNALAYANAGAALLLPDKDMSGNSLLCLVLPLLTEQGTALEMRRRLALFAHADAGEAILRELKQLLRNRH